MTLLIVECVLYFIFLLCSVLIYFRKNFDYWRIQGVPYQKPLPVIGHLKEFILRRSSVPKIHTKIYEQFPDVPYVGIFRGRQPALIIKDPELFKHILNKDFLYFQDRGVVHNKPIDFLCDNMLFMETIRWKLTRLKLEPMFRIEGLEDMFPLIEKCGTKLQEYLLNITQKQEKYELSEVMTNFTSDVIGCCAFGMKVTCSGMSKTQLRRKGDSIFSLNYKHVFNYAVSELSSTLFRILKIKIFSEYEVYFKNILTEAILKRSLSRKKRNDFIDLCLELKEKKKIIYEGSSLRVTDEYLTAQAFHFFYAGFRSCSTILSFALYELARNQSVLNKLLEEIDELTEKYDGVTFECVEEAIYLQKVIEETLRMYPPVPSLERKCTRTYTVPGTELTLEKGMIVIIPIMAVHRDPKYYRNPEIFDPDRFSIEVAALRNRYAYLPFGEGPRSCFGIHFAHSLIKVGIMSVLKDYHVVVEHSKSRMTEEHGYYTATSQRNICLKLKSRKEDFTKCIQ